MKTSLLLTLSFTCILSACGGKKSEVSSSTFKNQFVLGAFTDIKSPSTLNLSELQELPKAINLSDKMTSVKNQSTRGTCTFFSTMSMLEGAINKDLGIKVNLSEEFTNFNTKNLGFHSTVEGSTILRNTSAIKTSGLLLERDYGYEPSWFEKGFPCGEYKVSGFTTPKNCFSHNPPNENILKKVIKADGIIFKSLKKNTNEIIKFMANEQRPLTISLTVNYKGWPKSGDTFYNEELRAECLAKPSDCGAHAVTLTGYDLEKKVFFFKNSWGTSWGNKGYGTVTFETVDNYVTEDLFYAEVKNLDLPDNYNEDKLALTSFDFDLTSSEDMGLNIEVNGEIDEVQGRPIYISSYLVTKKKEDTRPISDATVTFLNLSKTKTPNYIHSFRYLGLGISPVISWSKENPLQLTIDPGLMQSEEILETLSDSEREAFIRTTIYVHTDDEGYKVLKREFKPL